MENWRNLSLNNLQIPSLSVPLIIINFFQSFASVDDYMEKTNKFIYDTGAKVFPLWIYFMYPAYVIAHPDHAKRLLKSSAPKDENVGAVYTMLRPWIGKHTCIMLVT